MSTKENRPPLSGAERQKNYKNKNPKKVELNQLRQNYSRLKLKEIDPKKAEIVREGNRKRQAERRKRQKEGQNNFDSETSFLYLGLKLFLYIWLICQNK